MKNNTNTSFLLSLLSFVKGEKLPLLGAIILGTLGHFSAIAIPCLAALSLGISLGYFEVVPLPQLLAIIAVCGILRGILHYGEQWLNHYLAFRILANIREEIFNVLRKLAPAKLEGRDKGDLINLITSDIEKMEVFFAHTLSPVGIALLVNGGISIFLSLLHWQLGVTALVLYCTVAILLPYNAMKLSGDVALQFRDKSSSLSSFALESVQGMRTLLQYDKTTHRQTLAREKDQELQHFGNKVSQNTAKLTAITYTVLILAHLIFLKVASGLLSGNTLTFGLFLLVQVLFMSSFGPVVALANLGSTLQGTFASARRVLTLSQEKPQVNEVHQKEIISFQGASVQNIDFSYNTTAILKSFSLELPDNKIIGIEGASGCGKSTFLRLLMRFWNVDGGEIKISNKNLSEINTDNLRSLESFVTQETHLFSSTIRENILIAKPTATQEELETACKKASIHDFISNLEMGYDTPVGHLGDRLSGGERQRIGLARAFLHDAPLLLLDEPTSNLDSLNEGVILKSIYRESVGKTVVLVSHRASTLSHSDILIKVEEGTVVSCQSK